LATWLAYVLSLLAYVLLLLHDIQCVLLLTFIVNIVCHHILSIRLVCGVMRLLSSHEGRATNACDL